MAEYQMRATGWVDLSFQYSSEAWETVSPSFRLTLKNMNSDDVSKGEWVQDTIAPGETHWVNLSCQAHNWGTGTLLKVSIDAKVDGDEADPWKYRDNLIEVFKPDLTWIKLLSHEVS